MSNNETKHSQELHCDEVQEVMGGIPHWIERWGITLVAIVVLLMIVGSYFFYYPEKVTADIRLVSTPAPQQFYVRSPSILNHVFVKNNGKVNRGDALVALQHLGTAETDSIFRSRLNGRVQYVSDCTLGKLYSPGALLLVVLPERVNFTSGVMHVDALSVHKVSIGQSVRLTDISQQRSVPEGRVSSVASFANEQGMYLVEVQFPMAVSKTLQTQPTTLKAQIIVRNKRLIEHLLQPMGRLLNDD